MFLTKLQLFAQSIGFAVIGLLMLYGSISIFRSADSAWGVGLLAPQNEPAKQVPEVENPIFTGTVPTIISYQGTLRDAEGNPMSGIHKMAFRIYANVTDPIPEAIWSEAHDEVTVRDGQFSVLLGDKDPIPPTIFQSADRYIGITVDDLDEMVPRQRFAAVPYAMAATGATYLSAPDGNPVKAVSVDNEGRVTINGAADNNGSVSALKIANAHGDGHRMLLDGNEIDTIDDALHINRNSKKNVKIVPAGGNVTIGQNSGGRVAIGTDKFETQLHVAGGDGDIKANSGGVLKITQGGTSMVIDGNEIRADNGLLLNAESTTNVRIGGGGGDVLIGNSGHKANLRIFGDVTIQDQKPIVIKRFENVGDNARSINIGLSSNEYYCVAAGWSTRLDVDEDDTGNYAVWTYVDGTTWKGRIEFWSDGRNENPDVDFLCFRHEIAEWREGNVKTNTPDDCSTAPGC
ncbi:hypothetical protein KFU94_56945 [Chloroflexi bacterium TSY]|nr:hypothetical protein [Chloroflexi bacterium TSY]